MGALATRGSAATAAVAVFASLRRHAGIAGVVVGVPLSVGFLVLALERANLRETWMLVTGADLGLVVSATLVHACVYVWQPLRWRSIARIENVPRRRFAEMSVSSVAVNNVFPGRVGDVLRARWLQLAAGIPAGRALSTVFVDRSFDVVALVVFAGISIPFVAGARWVNAIAVGGVLLLALVLVVVMGARVYIRRRSRARRDERGVMRRVARDTLEGLAEPIGTMRFVSLVLLSVALWATWAASALLVASALGMTLSLVDVMFVTAVINLGLAIPSSPGFIGTYQWLAVSALALLSVGANEALAFAIVLHAIWYIPTLVIGGALLGRRAVLSPGFTGLLRRPLREVPEL